MSFLLTKSRGHSWSDIPKNKVKKVNLYQFLTFLFIDSCIFEHADFQMSFRQLNGIPDTHPEA